MGLALVAVTALEPARYQQQQRSHIQMMLFGERTRFWR